VQSSGKRKKKKAGGREPKNIDKKKGELFDYTDVGWGLGHRK